MELGGAITLKTVFIFIFALFNFVLNIGMLYYLHKAYSELRAHTLTNEMFAEVFARMDKIATENIEGLYGVIHDRSENLVTRLENIHRRQNTTAKMIFQDREKLRAHIETVDEMQRVAKILEEKLLKDC